MYIFDSYGYSLNEAIQDNWVWRLADKLDNVIKATVTSIPDVLKSSPFTEPVERLFARNGSYGGDWSWLNFTIVFLFWTFVVDRCVQTFRRALPFLPYLAFWTPIKVLVFLSLGSYLRNHMEVFLDFVNGLLPWGTAFIFLATFKFFKVVIHIISYITYRPTPLPKIPTLTSRDVTVIIPTVGCLDEEFRECVRTILANAPFEIIISTVSASKLQYARQVCADIDPSIRCIAVPRPSKRAQIMAAAAIARTRIIAFADDHVFWPTTFLESTLACFEDPRVGHVGTVKRVRRQGWNDEDQEQEAPQWLSRIGEDFRNYLACIYLERHNFECTASSNIDGGVFVISGRTALLRSSIIQDPAFVYAFQNEYWGTNGPMNVDDDNFITRYMVKHGFKTVFHNAGDARMETTLEMDGGWRKFNGQLLRWARTTWRSNYTTLFVDRVAWLSQPWCIYAVYLSAFVNLALIYDPLLFITLCKSPFSSAQNLILLAASLLLSKIVKPFPHWLRQPRDILYAPLGIVFGYYHSLIKLYTLWTVSDIAWGTRTGVDADDDDDNGAEEKAEEDRIAAADAAHDALRMRLVGLQLQQGNVTGGKSGNRDGTLRPRERMEELVKKTRELSVRAVQREMEAEEELRRVVRAEKGL